MDRINIDTLRNTVAYRCANVLQGRLPQPRFDNEVNAASSSLFKQRLGLPETYDINTLKTKFGWTKKVHHDLLPFQRTATVPVANGVAVFPNDYQIYVALRYRIITRKKEDEDKVQCAGAAFIQAESDYKVFEKDFDFVPEFCWAERTESVILPPNKLRPIFTLNSLTWNINTSVVKIDVLPVDITTATLVYLKTPDKAHWGFTIGATGAEVYDVNTSVDLEWDNQLLDEISERVADRYLGNVQNYNAQNISRQKIATGT